MKRFRSITRWGVAALLAATLFTVPSTPSDAALPRASCMRDFMSCRTSCRQTYMTIDQDGKIIVGGMYGACLADCDLDLADCIVVEVGSTIVRLGRAIARLASRGGD